MTKFVIADTHFGHKKICEFLRPDGTKLRPWDNVDDMNRALVENWNSVVGPKDLVYVLGDFTVNKKYIWIARELNGRKILVKGNHDNGTLAEYAEYFDDVLGCYVHHKAILTHIPVHEDQLERFHHNIHGHLHADVVCYPRDYFDDGTCPDPRYTCVSVEHTGFKPVALGSVLEML